MTFHVRTLVTETGRIGIVPETVAERARLRLGAAPEAGALEAAVHAACVAAGARLRYSESAAGGREPPSALLEGLALRALRRLFSWDLSPAECDALVVVSADAASEGLARRLQRRLHVPDNALCRELRDTSPLAAMGMAQALLRCGVARNVAVVCVDMPASRAASRPLEPLPSVARLVAESQASDGAAAVLLSKNPGPAPLLSYRSLTLPRPQDAPTGDWHVADLRSRLVREVGRWMDPGADVLLQPGGRATIDLLAARYPALQPTLALARTVLAETGHTGSGALLWVLERAILGGVPLGRSLRLVAFGPGLYGRAAVLDSVEVTRAAA